MIGSVLLFPKEVVDGRAGLDDVRAAVPFTMGDVTRVDADGLTVPADGEATLDPIDGRWYHLEPAGDRWKAVADR